VDCADRSRHPSISFDCGVQLLRRGAEFDVAVSRGQTRAKSDWLVFLSLRMDIRNSFSVFRDPFPHFRARLHCSNRVVDISSTILQQDCHQLFGLRDILPCLRLL